MGCIFLVFVLQIAHVLCMHPAATQAEQMEKEVGLSDDGEFGIPCDDHAPFECKEDGCPKEGVVSCEFLADSKWCNFGFGSLYDHELPSGVTNDTLVRSVCPASCHQCCLDLGPFVCEEKGCPDGGQVSCTQLRDMDYCNHTFGALYDSWPKDHGIAGLRKEATVAAACRVSCDTCHELKDEL